MAIASPAGSGFRRRLARGYGRSSIVMRFGPDGVELVRVKSNRRWLPLWHLVFFVYVALLMRLVVMADMGPAGYNQRISQLEQGNAIERAAASVMQMDPVSRALAGKIRNGLVYFNDRIMGREVWTS